MIEGVYKAINGCTILVSHNNLWICQTLKIYGPPTSLLIIRTPFMKPLNANIWIVDMNLLFKYALHEKMGSIYMPLYSCHICLYNQGRIQRFSYGAIFSIIDGTNCSPKAVLACRSVNLVFISFRDGPFNFQGGYGFFLKKYSDSQCCWNK